MTADEMVDFREGAELIRQKASEIYNSFYNVFIPPEEQDISVPFEEIFKEEMKVFKDQTQGYTLDEVLGLTAENDTGTLSLWKNSYSYNKRTVIDHLILIMCFNSLVLMWTGGFEMFDIGDEIPIEIEG